MPGPMGTVHHVIDDPTGWSVDLDCDDSGIRGVFGVVRSLSVVNNSTYTIHLYLIYKGQRLEGSAVPGTDFSIDLTSFNVKQGEVTEFGVF